MNEPSDETRQLVWDDLVDSDRMCRYYGYLTVRFRMLDQLLMFITVFAAFASIAGAALRLPSITVAGLAVVASAFAVATIRNYSEKALRSSDMFSQLGRLKVEWELLWNNVSAMNDDAVQASWKKLSDRQFAVVERAPFDLPLSHSLARKSQQEAYEYWSEYARTHQGSATALVPDESRDAARSIAHC